MNGSKIKGKTERNHQIPLPSPNDWELVGDCTSLYLSSGRESEGSGKSSFE